MIRTWFDELVDDQRRDPFFITEGLSLAIASECRRVMREKGITQKDLADRMGISQGRVSRVLAVNHNMTLESMGKLASALDMDWERLCLVDTEHQNQPNISSWAEDQRAGEPSDAFEIAA